MSAGAIQAASVIASLVYQKGHCFLGIPKGALVSVSTHGCITSKAERKMFKTGLGAMLEEIQPKTVLVHGYMPDEIFGEYSAQIEFHRYASQFERTHKKAGA